MRTGVFVLCAMVSLAAFDRAFAEGPTVTDDLGRTVAIPSSPQRVIALTRSFMDLILEIDGPLVGKVEEYRHKPEGVALPSVGSQMTPDVEAIAALRPDLIIANTRLHSALLEAFESSGAAVYFMDPNAYETDPMTDRIATFGRLLERTAQAGAYIARLDALSAELHERVAESGYETGLMIFRNNRGVTVAQPTGMFGWFLMRLGIENVVPLGLPGSNRSTWVPYSQEQILVSDPDVILLRSRSNDAHDMAELRANFVDDPVWSRMRAVQNGDVYVMSPRIDTGIVGNETALRMVADLMAP